MLNIYAKIHKAQRAWLERSLVAIGQTDPADALALQVASADVIAVLGHLEAHAEHEDRFIDPVLREVAPELADRLEAEHRALDPVLARTREYARRLDPERTYRSLALLIAQYFVHLDVEEHEAMPILAASYTDDSLRARILGPFVASRTRADLLADLELQLRAVNPAEAGELLAAVAGR